MAAALRSEEVEGAWRQRFDFATYGRYAQRERWQYLLDPVHSSLFLSTRP